MGIRRDACRCEPPEPVRNKKLRVERMILHLLGRYDMPVGAGVHILEVASLIAPQCLDIVLPPFPIVVPLRLFEARETIVPKLPLSRLYSSTAPTSPKQSAILPSAHGHRAGAAAVS